MAILSKQIGWSQEANLIYELIKQTDRLNQILTGNQPSYGPKRVSQMIGWSVESKLYYEWLKQLDKLTQHYGCPNCITTTTTTSTTAAPSAREWCAWSGDSTVTPYNYISEYFPETNQLVDLYLDNDFTGGTDFIAASTAAKVWKFDPVSTVLKEWWVTAYPAGLVYSTGYYFGNDSGWNSASAMCAIDDTNLIMARTSSVPGSYYAQIRKVNLVTGSKPTLFGIQGNSSLDIHSMLVAPGNKLIIALEYDGGYYVRQYTYLDGVVEVTFSLSSIPFNPSSTNNKYYLFEYNGEIYVARTNDSSLFKIDLTHPYAITEVTANLGWSENRMFWSATPCSTVSFEPAYPRCGTNLPPIDGTVTYFGRTVTNTAHSGGILDAGGLQPGYYATCTGLWIPPYYWIAYGAPFSYTMTFSSPINNVSIIISILDIGDNFTITTNAGDPTITITTACGAQVSGNQIISISPPPGYGYGEGEFKITAPSDYTVLTINGTNYGNGGPLGFACDTSAPPSTTTTTSTTLAPTGINTIYTTFDIL
jgi:hypothetical protein